ncbi:MAG: hypothetical protein P8X55_21165 [Desulfosarcinaceae bacterium]
MELFEGFEDSEKKIKLGGTTLAAAKKAAQYLLSLDQGFYVPSKKERKNIVVAFAERGLALHGRAFDIVKSDVTIDFKDPADVRKNLRLLKIYEIKSTSNKNVQENFGRHFFSISTAELLTAQSLRERYRFIFVNTLTNAVLDLSLKDIYKKAKGIYPSWSIQF